MNTTLSSLHTALTEQETHERAKMLYIFWNYLNIDCQYLFTYFSLKLSIVCKLNGEYSVNYIAIVIE